MPNIRGQWLGPHPKSGVDGIWFERTEDPPGTIVGVAKSSLPALRGGSTATQRVNLRTDAETVLRALLGSGISVRVAVTTSGAVTIANLATGAAGATLPDPTL